MNTRIAPYPHIRDSAEFKKVKTFTANFLSVVLMPMLAPTYLFGIILFYFPQLSNINGFYNKIDTILAILSSTTVLPFALVYVLYKLKIISTLTLDNKKDRLIPQLFGCINYIAISLFMVKSAGFANALTLSMLAVTISLVIITLITPLWKISTHSAGVMGILSIATVLFLKFPSQGFSGPYLTLIFLTAAVCLSRIYLKVHTIPQIIGGCILGSVVGCMLFLAS